MDTRRNRQLGTKLVTWCNEHSMKQQELAEKLGITRQRLSAWEHNGVPIGDVKLVSLAMRALHQEETSQRIAWEDLKSELNLK